MGEQRFIIKKCSSGDYDIYDNLKEDYFIADSSLPVNSYAEEIVDVLNEQQATIFKLQEIIIELKDDKNQLHKVISKLRQEVAELKTRNSVLSSKLNQIPKSIKEVWLE